MSARADGYGDTYVETQVLGPSSIVVTRGENWTEESFAALRAALNDDALLIHLAGDETIETLDEEQMRTHGWVRA